MKRARFGRRSGLPREAEELIWLASGRAESGSRTEDVFWESRLAQAIDKLLHEGAEDTLNAALDHLYALPRGYDELADILEARAETGTTDEMAPPASPHIVGAEARRSCSWSQPSPSSTSSTTRSASSTPAGIHGTSSGEGSSKKQAEMAAALEAWTTLSAR